VGFGLAETTIAGDAKQVSMHFRMPLGGKPEDMELRTVVRDGNLAKKWISPGSDRFLAEADAKLAKDLVQQEESSAKSIACNLSMGPLGLASAAVSATGVAASVAAAAHARKTAHDFFEWTYMDARHLPPIASLL
jgi:hypothetical protein